MVSFNQSGFMAYVNERRQNLGMDWKMLSEVSGVNRSRLSRSINGKRRLTVDDVFSLAEPLSVRVESFISSSDTQGE